MLVSIKLYLNISNLHCQPADLEMDTGGEEGNILHEAEEGV